MREGRTFINNVRRWRERDRLRGNQARDVGEAFDDAVEGVEGHDEYVVVGSELSRANILILREMEGRLASQVAC